LHNIVLSNKYGKTLQLPSAYAAGTLVTCRLAGEGRTQILHRILMEGDRHGKAAMLDGSRTNDFPCCAHIPVAGVDPSVLLCFGLETAASGPECFLVDL